ncbi:MAG: phage holin family protein, partial [Granulosicoccus sp.]|nr:phage holin family protein [Granulosicoccus sp.]
MSIDSTVEQESHTKGHAARISTPTGADSASSTTGLISSLATDIGELMRSELQLARAEISESIDSAKAGLISMCMGAAVLLAGV